jgi:hypothetical protein
MSEMTIRRCLAFCICASYYLTRLTLWEDASLETTLLQAVHCATAVILNIWMVAAKPFFALLYLLLGFLSLMARSASRGFCVCLCVCLPVYTKPIVAYETRICLNAVKSRIGGFVHVTIDTRPRTLLRNPTTILDE